MKKTHPLVYAAIVFALLLAAIVYLDRGRFVRMYESVVHPPGQSASTAASAPVAPAARPASAPASTPQLALQLPAAASRPLPRLGESDTFAADAIAGLIGQKDVALWLIPRHLVLHIVATIDNLPRQQASTRVWPVKPVPGAFRITGSGTDLAIAPANAQRYTPYLALVEAMNPKALVDVYLTLYPLFEQAYRELGAPKGDFNARLLVVIDNLLAAPEPQPPVRLVQPKVLYQYADPALESASAGQKILMRLGLNNEREVKSRLRAIREELRRHMAPVQPAQQRQ
ncbi:hypothetical protein GALL_402170 [mine drainage metagenome]|uniref:DUF3014 domain-containing protein n=1 Tax=mine drainage metagenome TaxID=410659 RepID=A0A1J5QQ58_9ZZZZ